MELSEEPVSLPPAAPALNPSTRWRWIAHLLILGSYLLVLPALSYFLPSPRAEGQTAALSSDPVILLRMVAVQLSVFFVIFGLAWAASRATREQLMLPWREGWGPLWRGFLYSIGLRIFVFLAVVALLFVAWIFMRVDTETLKHLRPETEKLVDPETLAANPLYLLLNTTVVSFVLAGLREELWRAGMLAGLIALFPKFTTTWLGKGVAVLAVAILFGLGHFPQGWGGVALTGLLGIGLGAIMIYHRSIWAAVFAHGFFDATSFLIMYAIAPYWKQLIGGK